LNREVEAAVASETADLQGCRHRHKGAESREATQRASELLRDLLGGQRTGGPRDQLQGEPASVLIPSASAGVGHEGVDIGILLDQVGDSLRVADHFIVRSPLRRPELDPQRVVVRIRDESLGNDRKHSDRGVEHADEYEEHHDAMPGTSRRLRP
jgi:hypothetical protein